ncbi:hypothetical protein [Kordia jejudonensis]|uniref:hypothetical protein n=1 Tax=Kordia jejudonensis TaxID=1348245 RepID=UPI0007EE04C2|nr:hypothetical protein [Kordia jejudonensis]
MDKKINNCIECKSEYFTDASKMNEFCPDCAHKLYDYPRCFHKFENGRCIKCYWNGKTSEYIHEKKERITKKLKSAKMNVTLAIVILVIASIFMLFGLLSGGISYFGLFGLIVGGRYFIQAKKYKKELIEGKIR